MTLTKLSPVLVVVGLLLVAYLIGASIAPAHASAPDGIAATIATSSNPILGAGTVSLIAASSSCGGGGRVVTTESSAIMLTFGDGPGLQPTGTYGHLQNASTTVSYSANIYGCGAFRAYSFAASPITISESR